MNKTISTTLTVVAILALAGVIFFAGGMYTRANTFGFSMMGGYARTNNNVYGQGGMMGGNGGMMNGRGNGMGPNMMNGYGYNNVNITPLTVDQTKVAAEKYVANLNDSDLEIAEIMVFDNNGYVMIKETGTGVGAFELLVDPVSQIAYPEHGPNMMWNLKYSGLNHQYMMGNNGGMMGGRGFGMMGGWDTTTPLDVNADMSVTPEQAIEYAQKYLAVNLPGATAATDPNPFYGYYTLDFEKDGKVVGMLSVNGYSGQVFLHTWHGTFIEEIEYE